MSKTHILKQIYKTLAVKLNKHPTYQDLKRIRVSERSVRDGFMTLSNLRKEVGEIPGIEVRNPDLETVYRLLKQSKGLK